MSALLDVTDLATVFHTPDGELRAVDGVSLHIEAGQTLGVVGESGCGKSVTALSIMRLLPRHLAKIERGRIDFQGQDLRTVSSEAMRHIRGKRISMVFQEPMTALNPVLTVGYQVMEPFMIHEHMSRKHARASAIDMLIKVGIPAPESRVDNYPHELSGGMRQRVMIAMALACKPQLLLADEPTTALDVTVQAQILDLLSDLKRELGTGVMLITHDLGVVAEQADHVVVMYAGTVVERASTVSLFRSPQHPYTQGLLQSVPSYRDNAQKRRLPTIAGMVPNSLKLPRGCRFQDRCNLVHSTCREAEPTLTNIDAEHAVACFAVSASRDAA